jgi:hypothetical protein
MTAGRENPLHPMQSRGGQRSNFSNTLRSNNLLASDRTGEDTMSNLMPAGTAAPSSPSQRQNKDASLQYDLDNTQFAALEHDGIQDKLRIRKEYRRNQKDRDREEYEARLREFNKRD